MLPLEPQEQSQPLFITGTAFPQLAQKLPVLPMAPQEQSQPLLATGMAFPQLPQNLPVLPLEPQEQSHVASPCAPGGVP
jgi:hypothetical protein